VLYRFPEILQADTVYVVEGEKDADRLQSLGIPATTNPQGAGKWREEFNQVLAKKRIVILPDKDEIGEQHAQTVARSLLPVAEAVKIVHLPDFPQKVT
jgi:putative DNA primase/helicase